MNPFRIGCKYTTLPEVTQIFKDFIAWFWDIRAGIPIVRCCVNYSSTTIAKKLSAMLGKNTTDRTISWKNRAI